MRVIIPAAGRGTRLLPHTAGRPKCLVPVGGVPIIERVLDQLRTAGAEEVICVTGYRAEQLEDYVFGVRRRPPVTFVRNSDYERSDNIVSLLATAPYFDREVAIIDSDVVMSQRLVDLLVNGQGDAVVVDRGRHRTEIDMAVEIRDGVVWHLDKQLPPERTNGEFFGLSRWTAEGGRRLIETVREMVASGVTDVWYPYAIRTLAKRHPVVPLLAESDEWIEVDSTGDLALAEAARAGGARWAS
jgi:choline kinase